MRQGAQPLRGRSFGQKKAAAEAKLAMAKHRAALAAAAAAAKAFLQELQQCSLCATEQRVSWLPWPLEQSRYGVKAEN